MIYSPLFIKFKILGAKFTEKTLLDQAGKVFIVTGSSSGVGKELAQILYSHNASKAIESIKAAFPNSNGIPQVERPIVFLHLDLDDLTTIKKSAEEFLSKEQRLDVFWNNAGLLTPILVKTAKTAPLGTVRVVWVSSSTADSFSPNGRVDMDNLDYKEDKSAWHKYGVSKAGNVLHSSEYAKRYGNDGIVSVSLNPGNLKTELQRSFPRFQRIIISFLLYSPIHGAYTELFAGLSANGSMEKTGAWSIEHGDIIAATKEVAEGGMGIAGNFWDWSEEQVKPYL
ncbi:putative oxidoreductase [Lipomyces tetrasporus]